MINMRPSQGFGGTGGNGIISREQGNKGHIWRGTGQKDNIGDKGT